MTKQKEEARKKASEYFHAELKGTQLILTLNLEKPSADNRSHGTVKREGDKEIKLRDGKNYVIGRAFGKLPVHIAGKQLRINASIMLPVENEKREDMAEIKF